MTPFVGMANSSGPFSPPASDPCAGRDTRIDVLRALALVTIFVNHVPGNIYENLTHKNFGFSDAAEAFVLLSGLAAGMAYGGKFKPGARLVTTLKAWRRAGVLYVTHVMTTMATIAIFALAALHFGTPGLLEEINLGPLMQDPARALAGIVTLGHQLGYNNILSMYAAVLLMLPAFLLIGRHSLSLMLGLSGAIWLASGWFGLAPPNYPGEGVWFLNPLSWQFLFLIGVAGSMHARRTDGLRLHPWLVIAALVYVSLAFAWVRIPLWGIDTSLGMPAVLTGFDKTYLSLPRLLHVLALATLIVSIPSLSNLFRIQGGHPLAVLGKHSLPVFIAGTLLAMAAQVMQFVHPDGSIVFDTVLIATGVALQFALAYWLEWLPTIGWAGKGGKPASSAGAPRPIPTLLLPAGRPFARPALAVEAAPRNRVT